MLHGETITKNVQWYFLREGQECHRDYFEYPDGSGGSYMPCDHIKEYTSDAKQHWYLYENKSNFGYGKYFDPGTNRLLTENKLLEKL